MPSEMENMQNHQRTPFLVEANTQWQCECDSGEYGKFAGKLGSFEWSTKENDINPHESCTEFDLSRCELCTCQFTFIMRSEATPCHKAEHSSHFSSSLFSVSLCVRVPALCRMREALLLLLLFSKPILSKENECDILLCVCVCCVCKMAIENNKALHQIQMLAFTIVYLCAPRHETHIIQLFPFLLHTSSSLCCFVAAAEKKREEENGVVGIGTIPSIHSIKLHRSFGDARFDNWSGRKIQRNGPNGAKINNRFNGFVWRNFRSFFFFVGLFGRAVILHMVPLRRVAALSFVDVRW